MLSTITNHGMAGQRDLHVGVQPCVIKISGSLRTGGGMASEGNGVASEGSAQSPQFSFAGKTRYIKIEKLGSKLNQLNNIETCKVGVSVTTIPAPKKIPHVAHHSESHVFQPKSRGQNSMFLHTFRKPTKETIRSVVTPCSNLRIYSLKSHPFRWWGIKTQTTTTQIIMGDQTKVKIKRPENPTCVAYTT